MISPPSAILLLAAPVGHVDNLTGSVLPHSLNLALEFSLSKHDPRDTAEVDMPDVKAPSSVGD